MSDIERDLGRMETELLNVQKLLDEVRLDLKEIKDELSEIRGERRTLLYIAAAVGGALSLCGNWIISTILHK